MTESSLSTEAEILADLRAWVEAESPSGDAAAVNNVVDMAEAFSREMGCAVRRIPGTEGDGDHIIVDAPWNEGSNEPALLVLCHLDTVHEIGAFGPEAFTIDGDRLRGPGAYDMKGGGGSDGNFLAASWPRPRRCWTASASMAKAPHAPGERRSMSARSFRAWRSRAG